ncbi:ribbon-helix-helix protein, CopG family [Candidatus Woesearchaeota archaeon]|nr:MAG: ribbon-helix-helix protein, CopG family [Candidatus Woesearchaeota archaeon]
MSKEKIAISIDSDLLEEIDSMVDGTKLRSRSQAIEVLLKQSIKFKPVDVAVMLIHSRELENIFRKFEGKPFFEHNLDFLRKNRFKELYIVTQETSRFKAYTDNDIKINLITESSAKGTASALNLLKDKLKTDFVVFNGDTLNDFDIRRMISKHKSSKYICTMGLISSTSPSSFGSVVLDGEQIVDFKEKKEASTNIINAGIYIFKPNIFLLFDDKTQSLENDLFPKLAKLNLLQGFFTLGKYVHAPDLI